MKISHLTPGEEILMNVLWRLDSAYMREIIEQYPDPKPHPNTISTFLKILVEKEFLTTRKEGRVFEYSVAIPFEDYRKYMLKIFLEDYFNNSSAEIVKLYMEQPQALQEQLGKHIGINQNAVSSRQKRAHLDLIMQLEQFYRQKITQLLV